MPRKILYSILIVIVCTLVQTNINAQFRKLIHSTFELGEVEEVNLDLAGTVQVETWAGDVVMTETSVSLGNASESMLSHFIEIGRYDIVASDPDSTVIVVITSKIKEREAVKLRRWVGKELKEIEVEEDVSIRVFLPEQYEAQDEMKTIWKRKTEELEGVNTPAQDSVSVKSGNK